MFDTTRALTAALAAAVSLTLAPALTGAARAQQTAPAAQPPATPSVTSPIVAPTYRVSPEDQIEISVVDRPELTRTVNVLTDGTIDYPDVGIVKVAGMNLAELKKDMTRRLSKKYVKPQVTVRVLGRQIRQASVMGPVTQKGKIPLREGWRVKDVLAAVGGIMGTYGSDRYEFYAAELTQSRTGQAVPIDLYRLMVENDASQNLPVEENDALSIRELDSSQVLVTVVGQVKQEGQQIPPRNGSLAEVLVKAGGPTEIAALSSIILEKKKTGEKITVDMRDYRKTGFVPAAKAEPGDRIIVPENKKEYYLLGKFGRTGPQLYPEDRKITVTQAIALSGGQTEGAELKKTALIRPVEGDPKKTKRYEINVEKMLKTGDYTGDMVVEPGDTIVIQGSKPRGFDWLQALGYLAFIPGLYYFFQSL